MQILIKDEDLEQHLIKNYEHLTLIKGDVPYIHEFGENIGQIEIESKEIKSIKGDSYIICN